MFRLMLIKPFSILPVIIHNRIILVRLLCVYVIVTFRSEVFTSIYILVMLLKCISRHMFVFVL
jgi:hypothetical protein